MAHHLPATLAALLTLAVTCVRSGSLLDTTTPTISPAPTTPTIPPAPTTSTISPAPTTPTIPPAPTTPTIPPAPTTSTISPAPTTSTISPAPTTSTISPAPTTSTIPPAPTTSTISPAPTSSTISPAPTTSTIPPASTTPTIPPAPTTPKEPDVIDTQEQIYIISGVFGTLIFLLLLVSIFAGVKVISLQQKLRRLERGRPATPPAERPAPASTKRPAPQPSAPPAPRGRDNRGFRPDDEEERRGVSRPRPGDELQDRGFRQYPGQERLASVGAGSRSEDRPSGYDRFHKPMPDSYLPGVEPPAPVSGSFKGRPVGGVPVLRTDPEDIRYGAGNLARLPKGPSPGPGGYDRGYSYSSDEPRRPRGPRSEPEYSRW